MVRTATAKSAKLPQISGTTTAGETLRRSIATSRQALRRLEPKAAALDLVTVHHFRTALRRLRSLLSAFKDLLPPGEGKALSDQLQELSQHYAALREWDVLITALTKDAGASDRRKLADVAEAAKQRRQAAAQRHSPLGDNIHAVERVIAAAPWLRAPTPGETGAWNRPIGDYAADLFDRQRRKMRQASHGLDLTDPASFHKFRIAAKKHRYAVEYLTPFYGKKTTKRYLERLVAIQDVLGDMRDALTAKELVAKLLLPPASRTLAARWLERRGALCRKRLPACDQAFRREERFWEG